MRFRLKASFLDHAHNQIRGGIWYKPSWWDAVSRVPPVHFQPRINKQEVPRIHFLEDRLMRCVEVGGRRGKGGREGALADGVRVAALLELASVKTRRSSTTLRAARLCVASLQCVSLTLGLAAFVLPPPSVPVRRRFESRNPAIAAFDAPGAGAGAGAGTGAGAGAGSSASAPDAPATVSAQFVSKQMAAMARGADEDAAYSVARAWMLDNGPSLFAQLSVPPAVRATVMQTPESIAAGRSAADAALAEQLADVREALAAVAAAGRDERGVGGGAGGARALDPVVVDALAVAAAAVQRGRGKAPLPPYRSFRTREEEAAIGARVWSIEPRFNSADDGPPPTPAARGSRRGSGSAAPPSATGATPTIDSNDHARFTRIVSRSGAPVGSPVARKAT